MVETDFTIYESMLWVPCFLHRCKPPYFQIFAIKKSLALKNEPETNLEFGKVVIKRPNAYLLPCLFVLGCFTRFRSIFSIIPLFWLKQMIWAEPPVFWIGKLSKYIINKIRLDFEGPLSCMVIALMFVTFFSDRFVGGNGFLLIYICCGVSAESRFWFIRKTMFKKCCWWFGLVDANCMFLTLGLLVFPSQIIPVIGVGFNLFQYSLIM